MAHSIGVIVVCSRRAAAERAMKEAQQREKEEKIAAERKERARKYQEEVDIMAVCLKRRTFVYL